MIHYTAFAYDDESYVAAGENKMYMAVYKEYTPRVYHRWGETRWPSWAKFMHGDVTSYEEGEVKDVDELKEKFERLISSQNKEVGKQMTGRTADSRWTDNPFQPPNTSPELLEWYEKRDEAIRIWRETGDETMAIEIGLFPTPEEEAEVEREMAMGENFKVGVRECGNRLIAVAEEGQSNGIHFASFQYNEENYLAFGESNHYLAVFVEGEPRR